MVSFIFSAARGSAKLNTKEDVKRGCGYENMCTPLNLRWLPLELSTVSAAVEHEALKLNNSCHRGAPWRGESLSLSPRSDAPMRGKLTYLRPEYPYACASIPDLQSESYRRAQLLSRRGCTVWRKYQLSDSGTGRYRGLAPLNLR